MSHWWISGRLLALVSAGVACGNPGLTANEPLPVHSGPITVAPRRVVRPALQQQGMVSNAPTLSLSAATTNVVPSPTIDARLLVLSADGQEPELDAIREVLDYLGTPYTVYRATLDQGFGASFLAQGSHGFFQGILLTTGVLAYDSSSNEWLSAFDQSEWDALAAYEAAFKLRRAALYTQPSSELGFGAFTSLDTTGSALSLSCTPAGRSVFLSVNCDAPVVVSDAWAYLASPSDSSTQPLLVDGGGHALGAIHTFADGRQMLMLTFAHNQYLAHTLQLTNDVVAWVTGGLYLGARHVYVGPQVDDLFIADDIYGSKSPYRMSADDLQAVRTWQLQRQQEAISADLRLSMVFNGAGLSSSDPLTSYAVANAGNWHWINHTYSHANLDHVSYATAYSELTRNISAAMTYGLSPFTAENLVTPDVSGLENANAMRAAYDAGVRYTVSDTSVTTPLQSYDNPSANAGIVNRFVPGILMIPRRPVNLFYNVSTPSEWQAEYNDIYKTSLSADQVVDTVSDTLLQYMLKGEIDPWMFHQPNLRAYDGVHTLLGDVLDATLRKYAGRCTLPVLSPNEDELGRRMAARMAWNAANVTASIQPGHSITLSSDSAVTIPVTGLRTTSAEVYGGRYIAQVDLSGRKSVSFSLDGAGGSGGTGGGTGGASGSGGTGTPGSGGVVGSGGVLGSGGAPGSGGAVGSGGALGSGGAVGSGGAAGTGGSSDSDAGVEPDSGVTQHRDSSWIGCQVGGPGPQGGVLVLLAGLALLLRRRG